MNVSPSTVLRVRGLPPNRNINEIASLLGRSLQIDAETSGLRITSLANDPYQVKKQVATLTFLGKLPTLFSTTTTQQWSIQVPKEGCSPEDDGDQTLTFDTHFHGLTALNTPRSKEETVDCVAVCGLGGHAFGSFKEKGTSYMWLRDSLPKDLPNLRVLLYGYESRLEGSDSNQNISVIADSFSKATPTPLAIIAHSLGGLVVKQAILKLGHGDDVGRKQMESIVGLLFFGVPNRGMDIESLQPIVGDGKNRYLLESVGQFSDLLLQQDGQFGSTFHFKDSRVVSFFETKTSPIAVKVNTSWKMEGRPGKVLVPHSSATRPRLWEEDDEPFHRSHSDLVKFSANDLDYQRVLHRLEGIVSVATATLTSRYLSQESPDALNADEEACLRSLSFKEIYARESIIESAVQDTGNWLLESENFQDWIQRRRLEEHRGLFWVQGKPGSGKSTLMKKAYSHVKACPQDPSSVIAAFFFNARGGDIEKSPIGLLRTLLHTLCQRISALRDLVVKSYVAKRRLLVSDWQWRFNELKEFLAAVVTPSVLGQRSLLLFIDALDECDLAATQSVIQIFEDLANSSLSEGTNFSICLSSRYWPRIKIQKCLITRVEEGNKGDIIRYIKKYLEPKQSNEDAELHSTLSTDIVDKAEGIFLWVVLVTREILQADTTVGTLQELREIVRRIPPDLRDLYQHLLQSTEIEDRERLLRLFQLVFYAQRPISSTEVRYALAFGSVAYCSYAEWSQSSEYVRTDEQMEKRIREHSKGLIEIVRIPMDDEDSQIPDEDQDSASLRPVVQFIHQSVRDFLTADGFSFLCDRGSRRNEAEGHEFIKQACFNYLRIKELEDTPTVDLRVDAQHHSFNQISKLREARPLLKYAVLHIFPHAAQAEKHGSPQDNFRTCICRNSQGFFERWKSLHDAFVLYRFYDIQGPRTRPIHVLAQYGLLTRAIAEEERNIDILGGRHYSALIAACWGGHQEIIQVLLELGADPKFSPPVNSPWRPWEMPIAPFTCAVSRQDLPMLRLLLKDWRSSFSLNKRLRLVKNIEDEQPQLEALLAQLFPEGTFPDSAIDELCKAASYCTFRVFSFLLDKAPRTIVHEERLWHHILRGRLETECVSKIELLLDRGGRMTVTAATLESIHQKRGKFAHRILSVFLEHFNVVITEDLINALSRFENASTIICALEAAGYRLGPFTLKQLSRALEFGSVETAACFLQRRDGNASADELLDAALRNTTKGKEVARLLLGYLKPDHIKERAVIATLENLFCGDDLIRLLYSQWSSLPFSEAALLAAVVFQSSDTMRFVLKKCEHLKINEEILTAAIGQSDSIVWEDAPTRVELLLLHDPDIRVQESTVTAAIYHWDGAEILEKICKHGKPLSCTQNVVEAAADVVDGPNALTVILEQDRDARISHTMIMTAMRAKLGAVLMSVMFQHDHTIVIKEEHLAAAASNPYDPVAIFALLQTKGKLGKPDSATEALNVGTAKRRRISHRSSPRLSTSVINAAFSNSDEGARLMLLELFVEWDVIAQADLDHRMYIAPFELPSRPPSSPET